MTEIVPIRDNASDSEILYEIQKFYQGTIDHHDSNASELLYESIQKIIQVAFQRGNDKYRLLYELGFIFYNNYIAVNLTKLSNVFGIKNNYISMLLKQWTIVSHWDKSKKKELINSFENGVDLKLWTLRQPPPDDPVYQYFNTGSFNYEPINNVSIVNCVNNFKVPNQKNKIIHDPLSSKRFDISTQKIISVPPKNWEFDLTPKYTLSYI